ncbi:hypothetical protein E2C01_080855 [Portunus trituberculatus]|uniref:Uncharacterized protein n=1 Tax=Portunus trituberculatus TaxID=210409 RepID=A0A5B7IUH6_PORTR|nr:hypothetical protein [Portunus trituberculatus]
MGPAGSSGATIVLRLEARGLKIARQERRQRAGSELTGGGEWRSRQITLYLRHAPDVSLNTGGATRKSTNSPPCLPLLLSVTRDDRRIMGTRSSSFINYQRWQSLDRTPKYQ